MKRAFLGILIFLFQWGLVWAGPVLEPLTILHTNDMHAHLLPDEKGRGGIASISKYMKSVKAERENVLILDAGDMITGTPVSTLFEGVPIFDIVNTMPYDAMTLGNHEFDHGWQKIDEFLALVKFPVLSANIFRPDGSLLADDIAKRFIVGKLTIDVLGLSPVDLRRLTKKDGWEGLIIEESVPTVRKFLANLEKKPNLMIVLSHLGIEGDRALAEAVPEIDLIIGGHSHTVLEQPEKISETLIVQTGAYTERMGRLDLMVDPETSRIAESKGYLIPVRLDELGSDPETAAAVEKWESKVRDVVDVKIGENPTYKEKDTLRDIIAEVLKMTYETDYGYHNSGGTRAPLPAGPILKRHFWNILPFGNSVTILTVTREQLGILNLTPPEVDFKSTYTLATNSFVAEQAIERYHLSPDCIRRTEDTVREVMIQYVEKHGCFEMPEPVAVAK